VAQSQSVSTAEDTPLSGQVSATDVDSPVLTYALVSGPAHGALQLNSATGAFTYTPALNYNGADSFTFKANDGQADSNVATVSITVTPVNDPPVAVDDAYTTAEDTPLVVGASSAQGTNTLSMVSDPGDYIGQGHTYTFGPASGTYSMYNPYPSNPTYTNAIEVSFSNATEWWYLDFQAPNDTRFVPGTTYIGAVRFPFQSSSQPGLDVAGDGRGSNTLTGKFTVLQAVYDTAGNLVRFGADFEQHSEGATPALHGSVRYNYLPGGASGVLANDTDVENDPLTAILVSGPAHGTLQLNADGTFTYTPSANYNGTDSFTYKANDGQADSNVATVTITVTPVNDPPVANNATASTNEDTPLTGAVSATDVDGDPLTYALVTGPAHGTLQLSSSGSYTYTPALNYNGSDAFTFKANDGQADSNVATVSITVTPVNDPPVAQSQSVSTAEDTPLSGQVSATDVDSPVLTYAPVSGPAHGAIQFNTTTGSYTYTPALNYNGADAFTFQASDGQALSNVATVSITVTPVNDPPVAGNDSYSVNTGSVITISRPGVLANDTDVDGDPLTAVLVTGPAHGTLTLNSDGSFVYAPSAGYSGIDTFTYKANDGQADSNVATVSITVNPVAQPTTGKITGAGSIGGGRRFNVSVQSKEERGALAFSGQLTYQDQQVGILLQSTAITFVRVEADGMTATISGTATVNGVAGYTFTVTVADRGEPGVGKDTFRIRITGPGGFTYDSADYAPLGGVLDSGNLQVHKK
jgi:VCBS repeat-containing protein